MSMTDTTEIVEAPKLATAPAMAPMTIANPTVAKPTMSEKPSNNR